MLPEIEQFHKWLRRKQPHTTTALHYTSDLVLFFDWAHKPPDTISVRDVDHYIDDCQQRGHAIATINRRLAALRTFYWFLMLERDDAPPNPVLPRRHYIRRGRQLPRDVEDAQLALRDRAMFLLMLRCGLRVGEVRALSLNDLYLQPTGPHLPRMWISGKGGYERVMYLSPQPLAALHQWLAVRPVRPDPAVFLNRFGTRFTVTGIQLCLAAYCHAAGVWITCHQFRHTFGRHMIEAHMPATSLQKLLGHARLRSTQVYMHVADPQVQADYQAAMVQVEARLALAGGAA